MKSKIILIIAFGLLAIIVAVLCSPVHSQRVPFPEGVPLEHFSYFQYPTDVLGFMDCQEGAELTPEGNIFTGHTELIFLQGTELSDFPIRTHFFLEREFLPIHHWHHTINDIDYRFAALAAPLELNPDNNLIIQVKVTIKNNSDDTKTPYFGIGTRYSAGESEGNGKYAPSRHRFRRPEKPIRPGLYQQEGSLFSSNWMFAFKENHLLRKNKILYSWSGNVNPELFSYKGYKIKSVQTFQQPASPSSPVGIARFSKSLAPGEEMVVYIKMPYSPVKAHWDDVEKIAALDYQQSKQEVVRFWENKLDQGMQVHLSEAKPVHVYKASLIYDLIARDKIGDLYVQKVNEFHYDSFWLRDSAYLVRSYDLGGYHEIARQCLRFFFRWQRENGNFLSQGGQYDGWGQTLWALGQHFRLTRDKPFGLKSLAAIMKAADWLEGQMAKDTWGIMPASTPGDNEAIEGGHVTGHTLWALAGLKNAITLAEGLQKKEEALRLKRLYKKLKQNFKKVLRSVLKKTKNYIPPGLDKEGGQDWGNLMAVYPEEILAPNHRAVTETLKRSRQKYREKIMTYWNTDYLHHYLTMKNTQTSIIRGDQQDVLQEFYAILAHTSSTQAGFEFSITPWSRRDFRANLTPHGWFAAKYRNLLRNMLVRERGKKLHLLSVVSPVWTQSGQEIRVTGAPTNFGKISFRARYHENSMELDLEPAFFTAPGSIAIHIPFFKSFLSASVGKLRGKMLVIPTSTRQVTIKWKPVSGAASYSFEAEVQWLKSQYNKK